MDLLPAQVQDRITSQMEAIKGWRRLMKYATRMLAIAMLMFPFLATAQVSSSLKLDTQVPFQFMVGNRVIPAGTCIVKFAGAGPAMLAIQNIDTKTSLFSLVRTAEPQKGSGVNALVFHRYGDTYFLAGVKLARDGVTYTLPAGKVETELRAQNVPATEDILLAAVK
jgi:hypothetical protein